MKEKQNKKEEAERDVKKKNCEVVWKHTVCKKDLLHIYGSILHYAASFGVLFLLSGKEKSDKSRKAKCKGRILAF